MKNLSICLFVLGLSVLGCDKPTPPKSTPPTAPSGAAAMSHAPAGVKKEHDDAAAAAEKKEKDDAAAAEKKEKDDAAAAEKKPE